MEPRIIGARILDLVKFVAAGSERRVGCVEEEDEGTKIMGDVGVGFAVDDAVVDVDVNCNGI
jgi:hypothetical protein